MEKELIGKLMVYGAIGGLLVLYTIQDIRYRKVQICYVGPVVIVMTAGILIGRDYNLTLRLLGVATGAAIYLFSILSKEQIGKGDALVLGITGMGLGFWDNLGFFFLGLLCASVYCIFKIVKNKFHRKDAIPLMPFLLCGYLLLLII